jgi:uncharacterized repeat protein (TIGR02543 family)
VQKENSDNSKISADIPGRDGYVFKEWNTEKDGSGKDYQPGDSVDLTEDLTLYAQWEAKVQEKLGSTDSEWYKDYSYSVNTDADGNNRLVIGEYTGNLNGLYQSELYVPAKTTIDGVEYTTSITGYNPVDHGMGWGSTFEGIWYSGRQSITKLVFEKGVIFTGKCRTMFADMGKLTELDVSGVDTSNVTDMAGMFNECSELTSLDVSGFDTSNVENMAGMFAGCKKLQKLDVSQFNTSKVTSMGKDPGIVSSQNFYGMFDACESLTSLNVSGFNTENVTTFGGMFKDCSKLQSLDLSHFVTAKAGTLYDMFNGCSSLKTIKIGNMDTGNVVYFDRMFDGCSSLESLDVSTFRTTSAQYIDYMFNDCSSLTSLDLSNFDMKSLSLTDTRGYPSSTFTTFHLLDGCTALKEIEVPTHLNSSISNALPSDFYKTGSDGKADLAAGVFTALPTGLETSISLVRSDEISSGVEGAVSIAVPSGKIAVRVYAENGEVLAGADVGITKADGTSAGEGNTDDTGSFFCETSGKVKISVTKNGYFSKLVTRTLSTGTATCITLLSKSAHSYSCCSIMLDNEIDIQSEKKAIRRVDGGVLDNQIVVNIEKADTAADISSYALLQDGKVITNSSSNTLTVNLEASDKIEAGKKISVCAYNSDGNKAITIDTQLSILESESDGSLTIGKSIDFTIPDNVPILGGNEMSFDTDVNSPIDVEISENKIKIYIGKNTKKTMEEYQKTVLNGADYGSDADLYDIFSDRCNYQKLFGDQLDSTGEKATVAGFSVKQQVYGYGEAYFSPNTSRSVVTCKIIYKITGSGSHTWYWVVLVPLYIDISGEISDEVSLKGVLTFGDGLESYKFSGANKLSTSLTLSAGAGFKGKLDVEASGTGEIDWEISLNDGKSTVDAELSAKVSATAFLFSYEYELYDQTWRWYPQESNSAEKLGADVSDTDNYKLMSRDYVHGSGSMERLNASGSGTSGAEAVLKGIYPMSKPRLVYYGGKQYLFYLDDVSSRGSADRTALYCSVDGGTPFIVQNDKTADFAFDCAAGSDGVYLVWQNATKTFGNSVDNYDSYASAMKLSAAKLSGSTVSKTWTMNTTSGIAPMMPSLAIDGSGVTAAWVENASNSMSMKGTNAVMTETVGGTSASKMAETDKTVTGLSLGLLGGTPTAAWTEDTDGDLTTTADEEIYAVQGTTVTRVTSNDTVDSDPQFASYNGGTHLVWFTGSNYNAIDSLGGTAAGLLSEDNAAANADYMISGDGTNGLLTWWTEDRINDQVNSVLYQTQCTGGAFGSVQQILNTEKRLGSYSTAFDGSGNGKIAYTLKDAIGVAGETDLYVDSTAAIATAAIGSLVFDPDKYVSGSALPVALTLQNTGSAASDVTIKLLSGTTVSWSEDLGGMAAGAETSFDLSNVNVGAGDYNLAVYTDGVLTDESDFRVGDTNLNVVSGDYYSGTDYLTDVRVLNRSKIATGGKLTITANDSSSTELYSTDLATLAGGETASYTVNLTDLFGKTSAKSAVLNVTASESESELGDNTITLYAPDALDDLVSVSLDTGGADLNVGETRQLTATVTPSDTGSSVSWTSSDTSVATVDSNGLVTAVATGTASITATCGDNCVAGSCSINVAQPAGAKVSVTGVSLDSSQVTVGEGKTKQLKATITPSDATNKALAWATSDSAVASVSSEGLVTANGTGTATITVSTADGTFTDKCAVTVIANVDPSAPLPFTDVPSTKWYYSSIQYVYQRGLITGATSTTFNPSSNLTRGQFAAILYRMAGRPAVIYTAKYKDVPDGKYYSAAAMWSSSDSVGVLFGDRNSSGQSVGYYRPLDKITRQEMAAAMYRYAKYKGLDSTTSGDISGYPDVSSVSSWAVAGMKWAVGNGIITGQRKSGVAYLMPRGNATRAECAAIIKRFCEKFGQ